MPTCQVFMGQNGGGKSTILALLDFSLACIKEGRILYRAWDFRKEKIDLEIYFTDRENIYKYNCEIWPPNIIRTTNNENYVQIKKQSLSMKRVRARHMENLWTGRFVSLISHIKILSKTRSIASFLDLDLPNIIHIKPNNKLSMLNLILNYIKYVNQDVIKTICHVFGLNISYIEKSEDDQMIWIDDSSHKRIKMSLSDVASFLSLGTIRGILVYLSTHIILQSGGLLMIDGIEEYLQHETVVYIIRLFLDKHVNHYGALLYFSTYDARLLDLFHRNDNIHIVFKNEEQMVDHRILPSFFDKKIRILKSNIINQLSAPFRVNYALLNVLRDFMTHKVGS